MLEKRPAVSAPPPVRQDGGFLAADGSVSQQAMQNLINTIEASPAVAKLKGLNQLAEVMGQTMQIDGVIHFMRCLRKTIVDRATAAGIQAHASKAATPAASPGLSKAYASKAATPAASPGLGVMPSQGGGAALAAKSAAIAKVPLAKTAAKAAASKSAGIAKVPPPAAPKAVVKMAPKAPAKEKAPAKSPQESPAETDGAMREAPPASPPSDDALYNLVGELSEDPVIQDGIIKEARILDVFKKLWDGVARKPKDWVPAWQNMFIPVDRQVEALQKFFNFAIMKTEDPDKAPAIMAELVKCHKVKMRSAEEVLVNVGHNLDGILALNEEAWQVYSKFFVHVFPKPAAAGWGWSRVGWGWQSWWPYAERCLQSLEASRAFDVIAMTLRLLQDQEGEALTQVQGWMEGDRLSKVLAKLCEFGSCEQQEVIERLSLVGVIAEDAGQEEA